MSDVDGMLEGLRAMPADPRLADMDDDVLAGVAANRTKRAARRGLALTSVLALCIGLGTTIVAPQGAQAEPAPRLNALPSSAPSSLLLGAR